MNQKERTIQIMDTNKILLKNTFAFVQTEKFLSPEKTPWLESWLGTKKQITNRYGKIYKRFYEDCEVSADHIMALYKVSNQD